MCARSYGGGGYCPGRFSPAGLVSFVGADANHWGWESPVELMSSDGAGGLPIGLMPSDGTRDSPLKAGPLSFRTVLGIRSPGDSGSVSHLPAHPGFASRPSARSGFVLHPSVGEKRLWMDGARTRFSANGRNPNQYSPPAIGTAWVHLPSIGISRVRLPSIWGLRSALNGRSLNPVFADGWSSNPVFRQRSESEPGMLLTTAARTRCVANSRNPYLARHQRFESEPCSLTGMKAEPEIRDRSGFSPGIARWMRGDP